MKTRCGAFLKEGDVSVTGKLVQNERSHSTTAFKAFQANRNFLDSQIARTSILTLFALALTVKLLDFDLYMDKQVALLLGGRDHSNWVRSIVWISFLVVYQSPAWCPASGLYCRDSPSLGL